MQLGKLKLGGIRERGNKSVIGSKQKWLNAPLKLWQEVHTLENLEKLGKIRRRLSPSHLWTTKNKLRLHLRREMLRYRLFGEPSALSPLLRLIFSNKERPQLENGPRQHGRCPKNHFSSRYHFSHWPSLFNWQCPRILP